MTTQTSTPAERPSATGIQISTLAPERPTVEIDERDYELALLEYDFGVEAHQEFERDISAFDELWEKDGLNSKERKRLKTLLEHLFDRVVRDMPADVKAALSDVQKRQVISVFHIAPALIQAQAQEREKTTQEAGESSTSAS